MPFFQVSGNGFIIKTPDHVQILSSEMSVFRRRETFTDTTIRCRNGSLSAHKFVLSKFSKILRDNFFDCSLFPAEILCPDFSVEATSKVIELLYTGVSLDDGSRSELWLEMKNVLTHLGLSMPDLEDNRSPRQTLQQPNDEMAKEAEGDDIVVMWDKNEAHQIAESREENEAELKIDELRLTGEHESFSLDSFSKVCDLSEVPELSESQQTQEERPQEEQFQEQQLRKGQVEEHEPKEESTPGETSSLLSCSVCDKNFSVQIALKKHQQRFHKPNIQNISESSANDIEIDPVEGFNEFVGKPCPICDELFRLKDLEDHVKDCRALENYSATGDLKGQIRVQEGRRHSFANLTYIFQKVHIIPINPFNLDENKNKNMLDLFVLKGY